MSKSHYAALIAGAILLVGAIWVREKRVQVAPKPAASRQSLDRHTWIPFRVGEFRQSAVETGGHVRLAADTRGAPPGMWKHIGARLEEPFPLRDGTVVTATLHWPEGADASSMSASIVLSPEAVAGNPRSTEDWLEVSCLGTGPGAGRLSVTSAAGGLETTHFSEGSDGLEFGGRLLTRMSLLLKASNGKLRIEEDGRLRADVPCEILQRGPCLLYLMLSSDSNFPLREVRFSDLRIVQP